MKKTLVIILALIVSTTVQAQFIKERSVDVSIGLGLSAAYNVDFYGSGFYAQGEYALSPSKWIDFRPYAGVILTKMDKDDTEIIQAGYRSTANAVLLGGKIRLIAPIPWVAPYAEFGVGASIGSFETFTPYTRIDGNGIFAHIPVTLGLELGPHHHVNIEFTYYFHNSVQQFAGAAAFGLSFPLNND